ncbi:MAG: type II 3-dehydroquinate dehydratase [Candidatus Bipolaricaulota bacterium]|nr:type II 3-dehydroquinate dehydratase [Candidatus Bipolaricaulota bacterium]MBS3791627.1 type II 3-dehydroquinate dehydratase [Candidatus Bipolaricaulota bacterium]
MILVVNGPNLNLLGERKPEIYGDKGLDYVENSLTELARELGVEVRFFQSNHEGRIIDFLHENRETATGVLVNPGALTHYSYSLRDALEAIELPVVEVHISDIDEREDFRSKSVIEPITVEQITGQGLKGYELGLEELVGQIRS